MSMLAKSKPIVSISAVIIRADGTIENLGEISRTEVSVTENIKNKLIKLLGGLTNG